MSTQQLPVVLTKQLRQETYPRTVRYSVWSQDSRVMGSGTMTEFASTALVMRSAYAGKGR